VKKLYLYNFLLGLVSPFITFIFLIATKLLSTVQWTVGENLFINTSLHLASEIILSLPIWLLCMGIIFGRTDVSSFSSKFRFAIRCFLFYALGAAIVMMTWAGVGMWQLANRPPLPNYDIHSLPPGAIP
jgi:hypothetical protein